MTENPLKQRTRALIFIRALFITLLLGSAYIFRAEYFYAYPKVMSYLIAFLYVLTIIYSLIAGRVKNLFLFAYSQLSLDAVAEVVLIYITGGIESWFSFTMILTVLSSSIVVDKKAGYIIASLSSILYVIMLNIQFYGLIPAPFDPPTIEKGFLFNSSIHIISFYLTAYLGGSLSDRLEKTVQKLEQQDTQLKDLELFNIKVIESLPSGLFTAGTSGETLIFNRAAEKITGVKREAVIGRHIGTVLPFLRDSLTEGRYDEFVKNSSGEIKTISINISALKDINERKTGVIGVFQDITQLRKLEAEIKQKEKLAAIGELSSNIAHEIRNPLASMKGSIEMMRDEKIPTVHREKLMLIALQEMERLNMIVTDFLTYSSPKPLEIQKTDIHLLLDETLSLLKNISIDRGDISIDRNFSGRLYIRCDPQKIRQVFWNLGINAVEAMKGGGQLTVGTEVIDDTVIITFTDTGVGIKTSDTDRIFYPFFTTKIRGTGLGLSIAYRIIEEHRGIISVSSLPGIKTIFRIILKKDYGEL
ncbi:MAG: PAS domain S-box protein [Nitrospirae bacterium]|nr:PAS domain S-box protein [Nitrospirota bacterium]